MPEEVPHFACVIAVAAFSWQGCQSLGDLGMRLGPIRERLRPLEELKTDEVPPKDHLGQLKNAIPDDGPAVLEAQLARGTITDFKQHCPRLTNLDPEPRRSISQMWLPAYISAHIIAAEIARKSPNGGIFEARIPVLFTTCAGTENGETNVPRVPWRGLAAVGCGGGQQQPIY